jgi:phage baseplate assembly protein W
MARDIYMRDATDPYWKEGIIEVNDEIEMLLGQIKMLLFTNRGEILGAPDFGANLDDYLFTINVNEYSLRSMLMDQTMKFIPMAERYQVDYDVKFARGTVRDICLIDVRILNQQAFGIIVT